MRLRLEKIMEDDMLVDLASCKVAVKKRAFKNEGSLFV